MCDLADLALAVAVDEQVRLRVQQDGPAHFLRPVVEMGNATEGGFNATYNDGDILERFARTLRVDDDGTVWAFATLASWRVGIVTSDTAIRSVAIDHGVHVAGGDAEEQVRSAERGECVGAVPVRLGDDANAETLGFEDTADDGHTEAGVVNVRIAGDDDDVAAIPAEKVHFRTGHGQKRGCAEAFGPVATVPRYVTCGLHGVARIRPEMAARNALFGRSEGSRQGHADAGDRGLGPGRRQAAPARANGTALAVTAALGRQPPRPRLAAQWCQVVSCRDQAD